jgi:SAM-dependent methyltransferase
MSSQHGDAHVHAGATRPVQNAGDALDAQWWDQHYQQRAGTPEGQPSEYLVAALDGVRPGTALEAGCGTGADALWLARQGWQVTALDIAPTAIRRARAAAATQAADIAARVEWLVADLTTWQPPRRYDLVLSQYVHPSEPFGDVVARLAAAVADAGTLIVVGHDPRDSHSSAHAPGDVAIDAAELAGALDRSRWDIATAQLRTREVPQAQPLALVDQVLIARRRA